MLISWRKPLHKPVKKVVEMDFVDDQHITVVIQHSRMFVRHGAFYTQWDILAHLSLVSKYWPNMPPSDELHPISPMSRKLVN